MTAPHHITVKWLAERGCAKYNLKNIIAYVYNVYNVYNRNYYQTNLFPLSALSAHDTP